LRTSNSLKDYVHANNYAACKISKMIKNEKNVTCISTNDNINTQRIVSIGDIHGTFYGLLENLYQANITTAINKCEWRSQELLTSNSYSNRTILVQVGDVVDRGSGTTASKNCLKHLQATAKSYNSKVIRLLGSKNIDIRNYNIYIIYRSWLSDETSEKNVKSDTPFVMNLYLKDLKNDILSGDVVGAHVEYIKNVPILFTHAGIIPEFYDYLLKIEDIKNKVTNKSDIETIEIIVNYINSFVMNRIKSCNNSPCHFNDELFDAAPCRGGDGIGGPL